MTPIRELADRTPPHRLRQLDLFRAVAIGLVVLGHWLVTAVGHGPAGRLTGGSALAVLDWAHPATWLFQVMPVFFLVGGYANAASLASHRRRGGDAAGWLLTRSDRLVRPTTVLLVVLAGGALLARLVGADRNLTGTAVWLASIPLWFLVAYLGMVLLAPVTVRLHRRAGLAAPPLLLVPVLAGDLLRFATGSDAWAVGNYLFAWLAIHQVGFGWRDRSLPAGRSAAVGLLVGGLAALLLLTGPGPYPVSMVAVPGAQIQNTAPPTLALAALATGQLGVLLLLRNRVERWLHRPGPWRVVVAVNTAILTLFLWHMAALVLTALGLTVAGLLPTAAVGSAAWWWSRPPWLAALAVVLAALVALFGPVEFRSTGGGRGGRRRTGSASPTDRSAQATGGAAGRFRRVTRRVAAGAATGPPVVAGYAVLLAGLARVAVAGPSYHGPFGLPTGALLLYLAGAAVLRAGRAGRRWQVGAPGQTEPRGGADGGPSAPPRGGHSSRG